MVSCVAIVSETFFNISLNFAHNLKHQEASEKVAWMKEELSVNKYSFVMLCGTWWKQHVTTQPSDSRLKTLDVILNKQ